MNKPTCPNCGAEYEWSQKAYKYFQQEKDMCEYRMNPHNRDKCNPMTREQALRHMEKTTEYIHKHPELYRD